MKTKVTTKIVNGNIVFISSEPFWELISSNPGTESFRLKVQGGWIVTNWTTVIAEKKGPQTYVDINMSKPEILNRSVATSSVFVPDPEYKWELEYMDET
jgi:hypothetical protein